MDDFAKKIIGKIDSIGLPNLGMVVKKGQSLFTVSQGQRSISFKSPVSGKVKEINKFINQELDSLNFTPYDMNWVCEIDSDELDSELPTLKIGKSAVSFYQEDIEKLQTLKKKLQVGKESGMEQEGLIFSGEMEKLDEASWQRYIETFFQK